MAFGLSFVSGVRFRLQGQSGVMGLRGGLGKGWWSRCPCWIVVMAPSSSDARQECVIFCVREEPVLFLRAAEDFVPYTPRDKQNLHENLQGLGPGVPAERLELAIRKEVRATCVGGRPPSW